VNLPWDFSRGGARTTKRCGLVEQTGERALQRWRRWSGHRRPVPRVRQMGRKLDRATAPTNPRGYPMGLEDRCGVWPVEERQQGRPL